jgi:hypothetical protein
MDIAEFRESGYLQEANRLFFHPLGLALEVIVDDDGNEVLGGIWDYRSDPAGMFYGDDVINHDKIQLVRNEAEHRKEARDKKMFIQGPRHHHDCFSVQPPHYRHGVRGKSKKK